MTTIEDLAQAAYEAGMSLRMDRTMMVLPWDQLPEYWKRIYRAQVGAVVERIRLAEPCLLYGCGVTGEAS